MINARVIVLQKLYSKHMNKDQKLTYPKHRYGRFIKEIVKGTIERKEIIIDIINKELKDNFNISRTEILIKLIIMASIYEFLYKPETSINIIINEYLNAAKVFIDNKQKNFLNALLDKISKKLRNTNE